MVCLAAVVLFSACGGEADPATEAIPTTTSPEPTITIPPTTTVPEASEEVADVEISPGTVWGDVFEMLADAQQSCVGDAVGADLDRVSSREILDEDEVSQQELALLPCLPPQILRTVFLTEMMLGIEDDGVAVAEEQKACLQKVVDKMGVATLISALASNANRSDDAAQAEDTAQPLEMMAGLLRCLTTSSELSGRVVVSSLLETTIAAPIGLHTGLDMLEPGDAEVFNWRPGIPDDLPATAYRLTLFGRGEYADPPRPPSELIVATAWPRAIRANVLCLVDGAQVPCSNRAAVWRVEFDGPAMALLELPETEGRRDVIFLEERDGRPEGVIPVSHTRPIDGWEVPFPATGNAPPVVTNPLGGCDWVLFMQTLEPRETFTPIRTRDSARPVYMLISVCADDPTSYEIAPLVVVNETTVAHLDAFRPFVARPGATYAWELPDELFDAGNKIRGVVVREAPTRRGVWVTHPLVTNTDS